MFVNDLKNAKKTVLIESPFITTKRTNELLPIFRALRYRGVQVIVNTRNPEEHDDDYRQQAIKAIYYMQELNVKVLYTVKHHRKLSIIDGETLWEGSLNILSQNDSCEIMRRSESKQLAREMMRFIGASCWF